MFTPDQRDLHEISIPEELRSRGTGETISLHEATVFDVMPKVLGDRFRRDPELNRQAFHFGDQIDPFYVRQQAHKQAALDELREGHIIPALEEYKRGVHASIELTTAMADSSFLLTPQEIGNLNIERTFGDLENQLMARVTASDIHVNVSEYQRWVRENRALHTRLLELEKSYRGYGLKYPDNDFPVDDPRRWERDRSLEGDPITGEELMRVYEKMNYFGSAAQIAQELGDEVNAKRFSELQEANPVTENPKYTKIARRMIREHDGDDYDDEEAPL